MKTAIRSAFCLTAVAALLALSTPAMADDAAQIKELQAEVKMLSARLDALSQNASAPNASGAGHPVNPNAYAANAGEPNAANGQRSADAPAPAAPAKTGSKMKLTVGGFIDTTGIYRTKNETADTVSNFNTAIPFKNSSNSREDEFRGSARSTRLSLLASGSPDVNTNLLAYVEGDFLAAPGTANSVETNSYSPRLRQGYIGYERKDLGTNLYAGQMWSLATLEKSGLSPRSESIPTTIEIGTLPGFTYTRAPEVRVVKTFDENKLSLGLAADTPQLNVGGAALTGGGAVTVSNASSTSTYSGGAMSLDNAPDLIAKLAWDPGYGHYELFGMARWFRDVEIASQQDNTSMGGGIGAGTVIPVIDKKLDFQANVLAGQGVGRYGPALLPDVAVKPDLELKPLTAVIGSVGLIGHPIPLWDVYGFAGYERVNRYNTGNTAFGYGDSGLSNAGCYTPGGVCNAVTKSVGEVTLGAWHDMYKGDYGDLKVGAQDELLRRDTFEDAAGTNPHAYENITLVSLRYFPF